MYPDLKVLNHSLPKAKPFRMKENNVSFVLISNSYYYTKI